MIVCFGKKKQTHGYLIVRRGQSISSWLHASQEEALKTAFLLSCQTLLKLPHPLNKSDWWWKHHCEAVFQTCQKCCNEEERLSTINREVTSYGGSALEIQKIYIGLDLTHQQALDKAYQSFAKHDFERLRDFAL